MRNAARQVHDSAGSRDHLAAVVDQGQLAVEDDERLLLATVHVRRGGHALRRELLDERERPAGVRSAQPNRQQCAEMPDVVTRGRRSEMNATAAGAIMAASFRKETLLSVSM